MAVATIIRPDAGEEYDTEERCSILEMSNSTRDEALSIARARVEPGVTTAWHRVVETAERYVILEGEGRVEVEGLDPEAVGVGDVVIEGAAVAGRHRAQSEIAFTEESP